MAPHCTTRREFFLSCSILFTESKAYIRLTFGFGCVSLTQPTHSPRFWSKTTPSDQLRKGRRPADRDLRRYPNPPAAWTPSSLSQLSLRHHRHPNRQPESRERERERVLTAVLRQPESRQVSSSLVKSRQVSSSLVKSRQVSPSLVKPHVMDPTCRTNEIDLT